MEKTIAKVFDVFHCTGCNAHIGYTTVFSDGSEEFTCDCDVDCFGKYFGDQSYKKERMKEIPASKCKEKLNCCIHGS